MRSRGALRAAARHCRARVLVRVLAACTACYLLIIITVVGLMPSQPGRPGAPAGRWLWRTPPPQGSIFVRAEAAFAIDDQLREVDDLPSCHDADLGFGENATLRQVISFSRWYQVRGFGPSASSLRFADSPPPQQPEELSDQLHALRRNRFFVAALLHENAKVLPWWHRELVKLLLTVGNAALDNVFVSVLESNSVDPTGVMLTALFELLRELGIPAKLYTGHTGARTKDRIRFLSELRNVAMQPLLDGAAAGAEPFTHVIYLNDVFFCARGVVEMLWLTRARAAVGGAAGGGAPTGAAGGARWEYEADMACSADYVSSKLDLYDKWAAHDIAGRTMLNTHPFVAHAPSARAFERADPFQVLTCWNGLVVFRADAVAARGLRFRRNVPLECAASECDLFCRDMWSVGFHRILMAPRVKVAYGLDVFTQLRALAARDRAEPGGGRLRWATAQPAVRFVDTPPRAVECCPIGNWTGSQLVDFRECHNDTVWAHMYALFGTPAAARPTELGTASALGELVNRTNGSVAALAAAVQGRLVEAMAEERARRGGGAADADADLAEGEAGERARRDGHVARRAARGGGGGGGGGGGDDDDAAGGARAGGAPFGRAELGLRRACPDAPPDAAPPAIPRLISQLGESESVHEMPRSALLSIVSWLWHHPCHAYTYLTFERAAAGAAGPREMAALRALPAVPERHDFARYLHMRARGGVLAPLDCVPLRPVDGLLRPADRLVLVLQASFESGAEAARAGYAHARVPATDLFALAPRHPAMQRLIEAIVQQSALLPHARVRAVDASPVLAATALEHAARTGTLAFAEYLLGADGARVLDGPELSGALERAPHAGRGQGLSSETDRAGRGWVARLEVPEDLPTLERSAGGWARPDRLVASDGPTGLTGGGYLLPFTGRIAAAAADAPPSAAATAAAAAAAAAAGSAEPELEPVWTVLEWLTPRERERVSRFAALRREQLRASGGAPHGASECYLQLHGNATLAVYAGHGPADRSARLLYAVEPPVLTEWPSVPVLSLSAEGVLSLFARVHCVGPCEGRKLTPSTPPRGVDRVDTLWRASVDGVSRARAVGAAQARQLCAEHTLVLRPSDALLAVYCAAEVAPPGAAAGHGPPRGGAPTGPPASAARPRAAAATQSKVDAHGLAATGWASAELRSSWGGTEDSRRLRAPGWLQSTAPRPALFSPSGRVALVLSPRGQLCSHSLARAHADGARCWANLTAGCAPASVCRPAYAAQRPGAFHAELNRTGQLCVHRGTAERPLRPFWCSAPAAPDASDAAATLAAAAGDAAYAARAPSGAAAAPPRAGLAAVHLRVDEDGHFGVFSTAAGEPVWTSRAPAEPSALAPGLGLAPGGAPRWHEEDLYHAPAPSGGAAADSVGMGARAGEASAAGTISQLLDGGFLSTGQQLVSPNGKYVAAMGATRLCVYDVGGAAPCAQLPTPGAALDGACVRWCSPPIGAELAANLTRSAALEHGSLLAVHTVELGVAERAFAPGGGHGAAEHAAERSLDLCVHWGCEVPVACQAGAAARWCVLSGHGGGGAESAPGWAPDATHGLAARLSDDGCLDVVRCNEPSPRACAGARAAGVAHPVRLWSSCEARAHY